MGRHGFHFRRKSYARPAEARFYLSFFQVTDKDAALKKVEERHHEIKKNWQPQ
ncbi:hypothetical protein LWM68_03245 [Niabella sp. W65]|nr:hypothetical protein [Niabella sp. W65]MCH7361880.1 hypothetical protein [Niabella sp. W65]